MNFRTQYSYDPRPEDVDPVSDEIITLPDQSLSVADILTRFRRGTLSPDEVYRPGYDDPDPDIDSDDVELNDLVDFYEASENNRRAIQDLVQRINESARNDSNDTVEEGAQEIGE